MSATALPAGWKEEVLDAASDRFERRLAIEMSDLRVEVCAMIHEDLTRLRQELATARVEMLKWSFAFWVGQVVAIAGLLAFMLRGR